MSGEINFISIINDLNDHIAEYDKELIYNFTYMTDGYIDSILFNEYPLWNSEDDGRKWFEDKQEYEPFLPFIKRQFNEYIDEMNKYKF